MFAFVAAIIFISLLFACVFRLSLINIITIIQYRLFVFLNIDFRSERYKEGKRRGIQDTYSDLCYDHLIGIIINIKYTNINTEWLPGNNDKAAIRPLCHLILLPFQYTLWPFLFGKIFEADRLTLFLSLLCTMLACFCFRADCVCVCVCIKTMTVIWHS